MTLIVARIHEDKITAVSDTKITIAPYNEGEARRTTRVYDAPVLKLAIVRPDLAIGVAGDNPADSLKVTARHWKDQPIEEVLQALSRYTRSHNNGFVVAALNPPRLWQIANGTVYERTTPGVAWEGDPDPHMTFEARYAECPESIDVDFRLMSSMQAITDGPWSNSQSSVGGHTVHVHTVNNRFEYLPNASSVFAPTPGNGNFFTHRYATGTGAAPGAFAIFIEGRREQLLFKYGEPWAPVRVRAETMEELIEAAASEHSQEICAAEPPSFNW
ncbi:hypothetical protein LRQ08_31640 (plasmid) [Rhodococcus qingshengii]|uniref:hypothetical protein n=1 Tax=Rhodococcus qingshengii TaxID=334542 RepID=UPI002112409B|nr:hypothetical protein [Rhodococcus qingshengii]UUE28490.1 hypothetical protein LRQ08_31640 [Rhodococcus qingshengii]